MKNALFSGDLEEVNVLLGAGAALSEGLSASDQAKVLIAAVGSAEEGGSELLDLLLENEFDANSVDDSLGDNYQGTPLLSAAKAGRLDLVKKLVGAGADPLWKSPSGMTILSELIPSRASQAPREETAGVAEVRCWLEGKGAEVDPNSADSRRKMTWAASRAVSWPDISVLLEEGISAEGLRWTEFMWKVVRGEARVEDVEKLSEEEFKKTDSWSRTPFLLAVEAGRVDLSEALLQRGSRLDEKGHCGATALHLAARNGNLELIDLLTNEGLDVDSLDEFGSTPLMVVDGSDECGVVRRLIARGADVEHKDKNGNRVIHETISLDILQELMDAGVDVNAISGSGSWALADACEEGDVESVQFLLDCGALPDLTSTGETALHNAVQADSQECVKLLLEAGADVNAQDVDGWTCLWRVKSVGMARLLLRAGADPSLKDICGGGPESWIVPFEVGAMYREVLAGEG